MKAIAKEWTGVRDDAAEALALDPNYPEPMLLRSAANRTLGYPRASLVDANHAGCIRTRRSTTAGIAMRGPHNIGELMTTQPLVAASSGESEFYVLCRGAVELM